MNKLLLSYSDEAELLGAWQRFRASEPALPASVLLLYLATPRPARVKRWVSRGGWERLAMERARRTAAKLTAELASAGTAYEFHVAFGDGPAQAHALMQADPGIERHVDASSRAHGAQRASESRLQTQQIADQRRVSAAPNAAGSERAAMRSDTTAAAAPLVKFARKRLLLGAT